MDKLSKEEVMHIADLAMLELNEEEIDTYANQLKTLFNEIDKVSNVKIDDVDMMFTATKEDMHMFDDEYEVSPKAKALIENAPSHYENFIEVAGVFDE